MNLLIKPFDISNIEFNNEELKKELSAKVEHYNSLIVTEDSIKGAKADKADLNHLRTEIEERRKEIKRMCLAPYEAFEVKVKELLSIIDKPILAIDTQIKAFEDMAKEEKRAQITELFHTYIGDLAPILPIEKIFNQKWLNATYKLTEVDGELKYKIGEISRNLEQIKDLKTVYEAQMIDKFLQTLSLSDALAEKSRLEIQAERMAEIERKRAEEKAVEEFDKEPVKEIIKEPVKEPIKQPIEEPDILERIDFRVYVTPEQKDLLRKFIVENKIKCGKVD